MTEATAGRGVRAAPAAPAGGRLPHARLGRARRRTRSRRRGCGSSRSDTEAVANLGGWLTTVVARVCLDMLRAARAGARSYAGHGCPSRSSSVESESRRTRRVLADSVGLALLVVLDTLTPAERLAFVLHDMFGDAVRRDRRDHRAARRPRRASSRAGRGGACAARRRAGRRSPPSNARVVDAFLAASRAGDFEALLDVLDPDVVFRVDTGRPRQTCARRRCRERRAAGSWREGPARAIRASRDRQRQCRRDRRPAETAGRGRRVHVERGRIVEIDLVAESGKLAHVDLGNSENRRSSVGSSQPASGSGRLFDVGAKLTPTSLTR